MDRAACETLSLLAGVQLFFAESLDTFLADLQRAEPTIFVSVPRLWLKFQLGVFQKVPPQKLKRLLAVPILNRLIKRKVLRGLGLHRVRLAISGSAPVPGELIQWYRDLGLELQEGYGMSENLAYSHISLPGQSRVGYVGAPQAGVQCRLSSTGEVLVKSPGDMLGYYKEPELSRESFDADGFLQTGDRGELDERGRLKITGRVKELFKTSKGKYVAPAPIENLINAHPRIELCCVLGSGQAAACAVLNLAESSQVRRDEPELRATVMGELEALLATVNAEVEEYERLQFLVVADRPWTVEDGQLTPTLKIKRDVIEQAMLPKLESWYGSRASIIWE
jgi:long-subunit acyl-CoA synthetase (AMP-forming)